MNHDEPIMLYDDTGETMNRYRRAVICDCGKTCFFTGPDAASVDRDVHKWEDDHDCTWMPRYRAVPA